MHMQDIRDVARGRGMKTGRLTKVELVREIQRTEGNADCFATVSSDTCQQIACLWRDDCQALDKKTLSA
ncbi:MAG: SAP domain-containing protein [Pseudomonadota bacterium]|nr:MAG: SAP domain-containing protein [Pseudomonadota bacterium]